MRTYQVYKVKSDNSLEPMGSYQSSTGQGAVNEMGRRGNLSGSEWAMKFVAIPIGPHFRQLTPKVK